MKRYSDNCVRAMTRIKDNIPEIEALLVEKRPDFKERSEYRRAQTMASFVLGIVENHALYGLYKVMNKEEILEVGECGLEKGGLGFIPIADFDDDEFLALANQTTLKQFGFPIKWDFKAYVWQDRALVDARSQQDAVEEWEDVESSPSVTQKMLKRIKGLMLGRLIRGGRKLLRACRGGRRGRERGGGRGSAEVLLVPDEDHLICTQTYNRDIERRQFLTAGGALKAQNN
jgi:hypothetical protein